MAEERLDKESVLSMGYSGGDIYVLGSKTVYILDEKKISSVE